MLAREARAGGKGPARAAQRPKGGTARTRRRIRSPFDSAKARPTRTKSGEFRVAAPLRIGAAQHLPARKLVPDPLRAISRKSSVEKTRARQISAGAWVSVGCRERGHECLRSAHPSKGSGPIRPLWPAGPRRGDGSAHAAAYPAAS